MCYAERYAGRKYSTRFQWSPTLKRSVQEYRFWRLQLKQHKGLHVSTSLLAHCHTGAELPPSYLSEYFSEDTLVSFLRQAYRQMTENATPLSILIRSRVRSN
jgi:hypothetical protein